MMEEKHTSVTHFPQRTKEHWLKQALHHYQAGRYQEALAACERALLFDSSYTRASIGKGLALGQLSRYQEALLTCEQALTLDPNNAKAYHAQGNALYGLQRYQEAISSYQHALRLHPSCRLDHYHESLCEQGNALRKARQYTEAQELYEQALQRDPHLGYAFYATGRTLYSLKAYKEALAAFEQALIIAPDTTPSSKQYRADLSFYHGITLEDYYSTLKREGNTPSGTDLLYYYHHRTLRGYTDTTSPPPAWQVYGTPTPSMPFLLEKYCTR